MYIVNLPNLLCTLVFLWWNYEKNLWPQCKFCNLLNNLSYFSDFKSVPPSLLRVKLWYDNSFLDHGEIGTHDNALQYIKDTMALVYPSTCLSSLGTRLELEVGIISDLVNCLLFIKNICRSSFPQRIFSSSTSIGYCIHFDAFYKIY